MGESIKGQNLYQNHLNFGPTHLNAYYDDLSITDVFLYEIDGLNSPYLQKVINEEIPLQKGIEENISKFFDIEYL